MSQVLAEENGNRYNGKKKVKEDGERVTSFKVALDVK